MSARHRVVRRLGGKERLSRARRERDAGAFLADAATQGFAPSTDVRVWFEPAQDFGAVFGIGEDEEVCVRDRVMRADGEPVMLAVSRLPREITRGCALETGDTGHGGAFARLAEKGLEPTGHEEVVRARLADTNEQQILELEGGDPVLCVHRRTCSGERVVEINDMVLAARSYELRYAWDADG